MAQVNQYTIDTVLTNMSVGFSNPELIAEKVFPRITVQSRTGYFYTFDKSKFRVENDRRTGITRAQRVDYGMVKTAFGPLFEHSLEEGIEYEIRDTYPTPMDARADATENVSERLALGHEKAVADILTDTAVIINNVTLSGTDQWSDFANSDPFDDIELGMNTVQAAAMVTPNTAIIGYEVFSKLKHHPDLLGRMSTASVRVLSEDLLAAIIGVEKVLVGKAMRNTADEGQTDSMSYVWGKNFILAYVTPAPGIKKVSLGYTLTLVNGRTVDRWDEPWNKSEFVRATDYYEAKLVAAAAAYLIKNAVA